MYQNTPVTPPMAEAGKALLASVLAVLADPKAAAAALAELNAAAKLSEDDLVKVQEARQLLDNAERLQNNLLEKERITITAKANLAESLRALKAQQDTHAANVSAFHDAEKKLNERETKIDAREKSLNQWQKGNELEQERLSREKARLAKLAKEVETKHNAIHDLTARLGKPAAE